MQEKLENEISKCRIFSNLKILDIDYIQETFDMNLVAGFLEQAPCLEELTLRFADFEVISSSLSSLLLFISLTSFFYF
jgi:hypothetical protein